jgi:DNA-binding transcriptional ArsR family regulator
MAAAAGEKVRAMTALAQSFADPTRLAVMRLLADEGPQTVPEIAMAVGVFGSKLGNHLAKLRRAGLVSVTHRSRQAIYTVGGNEVRMVLDALDHLSVTPARYSSEARPTEPRHAAARQAVPDEVRAMVSARSCYGHLAGAFGVMLFSYLLDAGGIRMLGETADAAEIAVGDPEVFARFGVDPDALAAGRRRFAFCCLDWSENRPHLGGVLGDALLDAMLDRGQLARVVGSRALRITARGQEELSVPGPELSLGDALDARTCELDVVGGRDGH